MGRLPLETMGPHARWTATTFWLRAEGPSVSDTSRPKRRSTASAVGITASTKPTTASAVTPNPDTRTPRNMTMERIAAPSPATTGASNSSMEASTSCWPIRPAMVWAAWSSSWLLAGAIPTLWLR